MAMEEMDGREVSGRGGRPTSSFQMGVEGVH